MLHRTRYVAWLLLSCFCLNSNSLIANTILDAYGYIELYKQIAIEECQRTGIPASITLAQGIYESGIGGSELAVKANNHFGIKCKSSWQGESHYVKDDDYDANGKLMKSCFRKYESALASYQDHSDFLVNNTRYQELFLLSVTDYKGWAKGLKRCGYATNPKYADKLIDLIERYDLYAYDRALASPEEITVVTPEPVMSTTGQIQTTLSYNPEVTLVDNDPNAPAPQSITDYRRNSYVAPTSNVSTTPTQYTQPVEKAHTQIHQKPSLENHSPEVVSRTFDTPDTTPQEVMSAPMYDIEYYELTEKGSASSKQSSQRNRDVVGNLNQRFTPRRQQFKRRGR